MNTKWTCPNCETVNDNNSECIVCKMTYSDALNEYSSAANPAPAHSTGNRPMRKNLKPSDIKLNFPEESVKEAFTESTHDVSALASATAWASVVSGAVSLLFCMAFHMVFAILLSVISISSGVFSIKEGGGKKAVCGLIIGIITFFIALLMNIYNG